MEIRCTTPSSVASTCPKILAPEVLRFTRKNTHLHLMRVTCMVHGVCLFFFVESANQIRRASQRTDRFPVSGFQFHSKPYFAINPRYQEGSFQTTADMLRNQQREFVEPLMEQMAANLGDTLAASISFAVGQADQAAQNGDVRPRREPDYGTSQHRLLLSMCPDVQTLLRRSHKEVESRMDKLFTQ